MTTVRDLLDDAGRLKAKMTFDLMDQDEIRKKALRNRYRVYMEDYKDLVTERIRETYNTAIARRELAKYVTSALNPLKSITDKLAVAYKIQPTRELEGASEADNDKWRSNMKESRIAVKAKQWNRYAFLLSTTFVIPELRMKAGNPDPVLSYQTILPHLVDVVFGDDPDHPDVIFYDIMNNGSGEVRVALDSEAWYFLDKLGKILRVVRHDLGVNPAVVFRTEEPPPGNFWNETIGQKLFDVTVDVGRINAAMSWVRKDQNRKWAMLFIEDVDQIIGGQVNTPESVIVGQGPSPDFRVEDMEVSIKEFVDEMNFLIEHVAEHYGVPSTFINLNSSPGDATNTVGLAGGKQYFQLGEIRQNHIANLRDAEHELAWKSALVMQRFGHPNAVDPQIVFDTFNITYPPLLFSDHPLQRIEVYKEELKLGLTDFAEIYMKENPGVSREDAEENVRGNIEEQSEILEFRASRNLPTDPDQQAMTVAQLQGQQGGLSSEPSEESDESSENGG